VELLEIDIRAIQIEFKKKNPHIKDVSLSVTVELRRGPQGD
jgi:hypothetical protein